MKILIKTVAAVAFSVFMIPAISAHADSPRGGAGLFLEPYAFYESGTGSADLGSFAQASGDLKGPGVGLRFGGQISDVFFIAADGMYSKPKFTDKENNTNLFSADAESWLAGVTVGAQTPLYGIRVWGSYLPFGQFKFTGTSTNAPTIRYTDPKLFKVGAGIRVGIVSLNLEYLDGKYNSIDVLNAGFLSGNYNFSTATRKSWIASVSFPLSL